MPSDEPTTARHDAYLAHSHHDAAEVEAIANFLVDNHGLKPWLDNWAAVPGEPSHRTMAEGMGCSGCCAVFLGARTPKGWFQAEIGKALHRQAQDVAFRVIPVVLESAQAEVYSALADQFLDIQTWVDLRRADRRDRSLHELVCGIRGVAPGRWVPQAGTPTEAQRLRQQLKLLSTLKHDGLVDDRVVINHQNKIVEKFLEL